MSAAHIIHAAGGFHCGRLEKNLPLTLGLDSSAILQRPGTLPAGWLAQAIDQLLIAAPQLTGVTLPWEQWCDEPQAQALLALAHADYLARETFWQLPLWLAGERPVAVQGMQYDAGRQLCWPQRPQRPAGEVYRRYDPRIQRILSFRLPDIAQDASAFSRWMNNPRVAAFWEMSGTQQEHEAYLQRQLDNPACYPLIGCFDQQPFGYFEVYWAAEDRIGRHYRWQPFDRGIHMLVGEERWRGAHFIRSWLRGLSHFLFLDDTRTTRLVAEPRFDNQRLFRHLPQAGFNTLKEFDFRHKRSRLISNTREAFFREVGL
ncbi:acetyltransferase [Erwiniaceae bacterium BAC15a-03b]|uniref:Acetyltransferase n=1 Tax=Winslowiella arboricola TaxID=2978220 RepID=A0A9J6PZD2_9GAMM|nr:GNAT family N-acetyltransferase [Winslowiella arboricola]MCU5775319.1 acetyltransferase [Winslowiella arboricola]MCU5780284.1 acetyltransferase [Winslowiella arboricola]